MSVSINKEVVIKDACILFDLIDLGLLSSFYKLDLLIVTTPQVIDEIKSEEQHAEISPYIETGRLQIDRFGVFESIITITDTNPGLSFTDASVLEVASRRNATILSSDKSLRNESQRRGLTVRGLLWILETLYTHQIIEISTFLCSLSKYQEINKWAPKSLIETMKKKYSK